jgi:hypothetical protein
VRVVLIGSAADRARLRTVLAGAAIEVVGEAPTIADARLDISDQTVKSRVASICGKFGAANRTDAVRIAVRHGLVTL